MERNINNFNRIIDWLKADGGRHFMMSGWYCDADIGVNANEYTHCQTAMCIGGLIDQFIQLDSGVPVDKIQTHARFYDPPSALVAQGAAFLGIDKQTAVELFQTGAEADGRWIEPKSSFFDIDRFDELVPPETRAAIGIVVLEHARDTGSVEWIDVIEKYDIEL